MAVCKNLDIALLRSSLDYNKETGILKWKVSVGKAKAGSECGSIHKLTGYKRLTVKGRTLSHHRVIWAIHYGEQPPSIIDHIDGNKTNNKIDNLRSGSNAVNQQNQTKAHKRNLTSRHLGVSLFKGRWRAKIYHNKKYIFLGYFKTELEAAKAYKKAKRKHHSGSMM